MASVTEELKRKRGYLDEEEPSPRNERTEDRKNEDNNKEDRERINQTRTNQLERTDSQQFVEDRRTSQEGMTRPNVKERDSGSAPVSQGDR
jgi:hypothetical protein